MRHDLPKISPYGKQIKKKEKIFLVLVVGDDANEASWRHTGAGFP
jgi:hypothetical protein